MALPPGASNEVTVDTFKLYGCRCDEPLLERLIDAVRDPAGSPQVTLEARWNGTRLHQESLAAVKAAIRRSFNPGDPNQLDQLRVVALNADRQVTVELGRESATVSVESEDGAWALGKAEQLRRILRAAGGTTRPRRWRPALCAAASGALVAVGLAILWISGLATPVGLGAALVGAAAAAAFLLARRMLRKSRPIIWINGALPRHGWREWSISDRIAFLGFLVAILAIVVPLLASWWHLS
jgi:hypothetical protein